MSPVYYVLCLPAKVRRITNEKNIKNTIGVVPPYRPALTQVNQKACGQLKKCNRFFFSLLLIFLQI